MLSLQPDRIVLEPSGHWYSQFWVTLAKHKDSGKKSVKKFHGSSMVRSHLYAWAVCSVAPSDYRIKSDIGKQLSDRYHELRQTVKGKDALIRILFKVTRLLYYELVKELVR